ncbi:MAG: response regulator [Helicobacteraceae bacterium]|nr:response regulator [Helicobacteraceae bacterium]
MNIFINEESETISYLLQEIVYECIEEYNIETFNIDAHNNAEDTLDAIRECGDFDLLFTAIHNGNLDEATMLELLLREHPKKISKIFVIIRVDQMHLMQEFKSLGAKRFIKKPINIENFKHHVIPEIRKIVRSM